MSVKKVYMVRVIVIERKNDKNEHFFEGAKVRIEQNPKKVEPDEVVVEGILQFEEYENTFYINPPNSKYLVYIDPRNIVKMTQL